MMKEEFRLSQVNIPLAFESPSRCKNCATVASPLVGEAAPECGQRGEAWYRLSSEGTCHTSGAKHRIISRIRVRCPLTRRISYAGLSHKGRGDAQHLQVRGVEVNYTGLVVWVNKCSSWFPVLYVISPR